MWFEYRPRSLKPFLARWRDASRRVKTRSFSSERDRDAFKAAFDRAKKKEGKVVRVASAVELARWAEFDSITGGADPLTVAREWLAFRSERDRSLPVKFAVEQYQAAMASRKLSPDSVGHRDLHLARFVEFVGNKTLRDVTPQVVVEWLGNLPLTRGKAAASPKTVHAHRASVNRFFSHAVAARWTDYNPVSAVPVPDLEHGETINILTVEEARALFANNEGSVAIGRLALEAFGGLRYTSAARLTAEDLNHEDCGITMPGPKHKSGRRHYVEGWPANLWLWVKHAPEACWDLTQRQYADAKRIAFINAGLKGDGASDEERLRNALRHSFATYHAAAFRDLEETARLLTHRSKHKLYSNYMGRATEGEGRAYFEIKPTLLLNE